MRFQDQYCSLERPTGRPVKVRKVVFPDLYDANGTMVLAEPEDLGDLLGPGKGCTLVVRGLLLKIDIIRMPDLLGATYEIIIQDESRWQELLKIAEAEARACGYPS